MVAPTKGFLCNDIEKAMRETKRTYESLTEESWQKKAAETPDYEPIPKRGRFYDPDTKGRYNARVTELRTQANRAVTDFLKNVKVDAIKSPTDEELRSVQMFMLTDPSTLKQTDFLSRVEGMLDKYSGSALTYEAIRSHAAKHGIRDIPPHPAMQQAEALENIPHNVDRFFQEHILSPGKDESPITDGEIAWMMHCIREECGVLGD